MKTTLSYFQGMFENPAPAKNKIINLKKQNQKYYVKYYLYTNRMRRKIIDVFCLLYLMDLSGIKFYYFTIRIECWNNIII